MDTDEYAIKCYDTAIAQLIKLLEANTDPETAHREADDILICLVKKHGYTETAKAFKELKKWYA